MSPTKDLSPSPISRLDLELIDLHGYQIVDVGSTELAVELPDELLFVLDHLAEVVLIRSQQLLKLALLSQAIDVVEGCGSVAVVAL